MKELLAYIVKNLVSEPDAIAITEEIDGDNITFSLRVAPGDMGRVIGRHGRIAKEIRTLMKAAGNRENKRVTVDILDKQLRLKRAKPVPNEARPCQAAPERAIAPKPRKNSDFCSASPLYQKHGRSPHF